MKKYLIFLLVFHVNIFAQTKQPDEYAVTHWSLDDGLPQSSVNAVLQSHDGYIWLTTFGGLVRFDGVKFEVFDRSNSPGMLSDRAINLFEDREGRLWVSTEQGLTCYSNGMFKTYTVKDGLKNNIVIKMMEDKEGNLWAFSINNYVHIFTGGRFIVQSISDNSALIKRAKNGEGEFLFFNDKKILRLIENKLIPYIDINDYTTHEPVDVKENQDGLLFIATHGGGLIIINPRSGEKVQQINISDKISLNNIQRIIIDKTGNIWAAGSGGVWCINLPGENKTYSVTQINGLTGERALCITQDHEGNYWAGTETGGLNKIRKTIFRTFGAEQGLKTENLLSLCYRKNGTLLIATNCGGIYELKNGKVYFSSLNKVLPNMCVWSIFEDSKKRIWISASDLILIDGDKTTYFSLKIGISSLSIYAIYEDKAGAIWVGSYNGLFKYLNGTFSQYTTKDGLSSNEVRSIFEDSKGNLWAGTTDGLNKIKNGKIEAYTSFPGASSSYIRAIYEDKEGIMWFGSYGGGLIRLSADKENKNKFTVFTTNDGLFDNVVSHIVEDNYGYFWMGSNRGISRVSRKELNDYAEGKIRKLNVTSYGKQDGLVTVETNGGFQPNAVKDKDGRIYFPTLQGLVIADPREILFNNNIPEVHIEKMFVKGKSLPPNPPDESGQALPKEGEIQNSLLLGKGRGWAFSYDSSDIQIQYTALSYIEPKKVKFKYKLENYDESWIDAGTRRAAYYTKLPPGEYIFKVIASNNDGLWNDKGDMISFTILPPFWMTWWFRTIIILLFLSIGPFIYWRRIQIFTKEKIKNEIFTKKLIENQENERKRIAAELHDSLGQTLLIIKNRALMGLNVTNQESKEKKQFEEISLSASEAINETREIAYSLRPYQLDRTGLTKTLTTMLEKISASSNITFDILIDPLEYVFLREEEINVYRIIQESVSNIVRHSGASQAAVHITRLDGSCNILVRDNGTGIKQHENKDDSLREGGFGMTGIAERVRILGGTIMIESSLGKGTTISIIIPRNTTQ